MEGVPVADMALWERELMRYPRKGLYWEQGKQGFLLVRFTEHKAMAVASAPAPSTRPGLLDRISTALYIYPAVVVDAAAVRPAAGLYDRGLPGVAGGAADPELLPAGRLQRQGRAGVYSQELRCPPAAGERLAIILRTVIMAAAVTAACAYSPSRWPTTSPFASPRCKGLALPGRAAAALVQLPRARLCLETDPLPGEESNVLLDAGGLGWVVDGMLGLPAIGGPSLAVSAIGMFVAFVYVWLPYMVLPIQAASRSVPRSYLEASSDLGAAPSQTFRNVVLPLAFPGVVAGSIFTFSLTLGDFIVPTVLGNSAFFIGQAVLAYQGTAGNLPLAAAFAVVPMVIMVTYLLGAKELGAFEAF